ncbi:FK506-binding protein 59-like [Melanaphis sacchari]|uniref:FK506-binding protein 59-like n=1 Tax=Melanaphis sacchari TaxID=742174 RepID=UPI000DC133E9|nr:FK506-binding protein 59-like [Melanaphis sacchari]XP_025197721.1 FK506-binding protein 59-like [Melanaphis sacchari]
MDITPNLDGGVLKEILVHGNGTDKPFKGCRAYVHYTGSLSDGTVFDKTSSVPFQFTIGKDMTIKGFDLAVSSMTCDERSTFRCHPDYGYGSDGFEQIIPPNTWLTFEIHLVKWTWEDISRRKDKSITRQILEYGVGHATPSSVSLVNIHLEKEENGNVIEERDVEFRLGEGKDFGICSGIEIALTKFKAKEKSRLFIHGKHTFLEFGDDEFKEVYVIKLNFFEKFEESWSLTCEDRIEQAKFFKQKGTDYFKMDNYKLALKFYKKMEDYLKNNISIDENQMKEIKFLSVTSYLNSALCNLKSHRHTQAKNDCECALNLEPTNVKAMFRKGEALVGLHELIAAKQCFEAVLQQEPNNRAAIAKIIECDKKLKSQKKIEKSVYSNMFEKFAKRDTEKEEEFLSQQPDVMNTLGEWGDDERERAPTEFEKENPNILMLNTTGYFKNM